MTSSLKTTLQRVFLTVLCVAFLFAIIVPFLPADFQMAELIGLLSTTSGIILLYAGLIFCCLLPLEQPGLRAFSLLGVGVCVLSMVYFLLRAWSGFSASPLALFGLFAEFRALAAIAMFSIAFALASVLLRLRVRNATVRRVRAGVLAAIGGLVLLNLLALLEIRLLGTVYVRLLTLFYVLTGFGTVITFYLHEISRPVVPSVGEDEGEVFGYVRRTMDDDSLAG